MKKTIITFGSDHLTKLPVDPTKVLLVVSGMDTESARQKVFSSFIGGNFSTSYDYAELERLKSGPHDKIYSLPELVKMYQATIKTGVIAYAQKDDAELDSISALSCSTASNGRVYVDVDDYVDLVSEPVAMIDDILKACLDTVGTILFYK